MPVLGRCSVDHEVTRTSEIRKAVGAIFCTNPVARRFQRHPFYNHVFFCFFVGAYLFLRNQVGPNQIIPIKLASKTSAEISSWILYVGKVFHIFFCTQMLLRRTSLCTGHCYALTRTHFTERDLPRAEAFHVQNRLSLVWDVFCAFGVGRVRPSGVLPFFRREFGTRESRFTSMCSFFRSKFGKEKNKSPCYWALGLLVAMRL